MTIEHNSLIKGLSAADKKGKNGKSMISRTELIKHSHWPKGISFHVFKWYLFSTGMSMKALLKWYSICASTVKFDKCIPLISAHFCHYLHKIIHILVLRKGQEANKFGKSSKSNDTTSYLSGIPCRQAKIIAKIINPRNLNSIVHISYFY